MARLNKDLGENKELLSNLPGYKVETDDPDPRGWSVCTNDGRRIGEVQDLVVDTSAMKVRQLVVDLEDKAIEAAAGDRTVVMDVNKVDVRRDTRQVYATDVSANAFTSRPGAGAYARPDTAYDRNRLTRAEEEVQVGKREVVRGEARIGKHVETEHVSTPVTKRREEVEIERRPVSPDARHDASVRNIGNKEVRVPLMEEEVIVQKKPVVKEELIAGKKVVEDRDTVETDVRREKFDIDTDVARDREPRRRDRY